MRMQFSAASDSNAGNTGTVTQARVKIRNELDPPYPYSCQIGICGTCRARLIEGSVRMDEREALTDEEIEEGYILTCQAHPETSVVVIDYDRQSDGIRMEVQPSTVF